jgi:hypothetical protein
MGVATVGAGAVEAGAAARFVTRGGRAAAEAGRCAANQPTPAVVATGWLKRPVDVLKDSMPIGFLL